ncbi:MAG: signal peptidase II [Actinobacteria bacterium]|nr:signal peptidase II [Actinomycetota bacterium]
MTVDAPASPDPAAPPASTLPPPGAQRMRAGRRWTFALAVAVMALDQVLKVTIDALLPVGGARVFRLFDFQRVYNPGINFGVLREHPAPVLVASVLIGAGFLLYVVWRPPRSWWSALGFGLLLGGGAGNLIDRVRLGAVFDYLNITPFVGYLNLADLAIGGGILVALLDAVWPRKRPAESSR